MPVDGGGVAGWACGSWWCTWRPMMNGTAWPTGRPSQKHVQVGQILRIKAQLYAPTDQ
jgi:hypothetical protein